MAIKWPKEEKLYRKPLQSTKMVGGMSIRWPQEASTYVKWPKEVSLKKNTWKRFPTYRGKKI